MLLVLNHRINHGSKQNKIAIIKRRHGGGPTRLLNWTRSGETPQISSYLGPATPQDVDLRPKIEAELKI